MWVRTTVSPSTPGFDNLPINKLLKIAVNFKKMLQDIQRSLIQNPHKN